MFFETFDSEVATSEVVETDENPFDTLTLDEKIEMAEFGLKCAQSHLDELLAERQALEIQEQAALDQWADANAPEDVCIDNPSRWEIENGI